MNGGGWEGLDMSTICLDMLLGLPHLEMAGWVVFIGPNPPYSRWTAYQFLTLYKGFTLYP
jgi:hypothetical protein